MEYDIFANLYSTPVEEILPVAKKCKYVERVRVTSMPHSSIDEEKLKKMIRRHVSHDIRFAREWPRCLVHDKTIPLAFEVDHSLYTISGYFKCWHCTSPKNHGYWI